MAVNFVAPGRSIEVKAGGSVAAGSGQVVGDLFGVAASNAALNEPYTLYLSGIFTLKKAADVINQGAKVYWDSGQSQVTTTKGSNKLIGAAARGAASGDAVADILLNDCIIFAEGS